MITFNNKAYAQIHDSAVQGLNHPSSLGSIDASTSEAQSQSFRHRNSANPTFLQQSVNNTILFPQNTKPSSAKHILIASRNKKTRGISAIQIWLSDFCNGISKVL